MADLTYRANLKAASFPFLSELFGRSIIVKGPDQSAPIGTVTAGTVDNSNQGIPQIYYCHNVVPTDNGYKSVGYTSAIPAVVGSGTFVKVVKLRDSVGNSADLAIDSTGALFVLEYGTSAWVTGVTGAPVAATILGKRMTVGFVSGTTYIYFATIGCYYYDFVTSEFVAAPLSLDAPLTATDIIGISANRGYLIAYTTAEVLWSSTVDPTDLVASLATGAGGGSIEGAKGPIATVESLPGGMIIFTTANAVTAVASDNARYPYNFKESTGCGGLTDAESVTYESNSSLLYAYTTAGLQQLSAVGAAVVFPEVTDFISGKLIEDFNDSTNTLSTTTLTAPLLRRLVSVGSRYLVISYGISTLTHALFYDIAYKQWGKLKVTHVDCFEFLQSGVDPAKSSVGFLKADGSIVTLNSDIINTAASGVMLVGKFQYVRSRLLQLQRAEVENVNVSDTFSCLDLPCADGKNFGTALTGYLATTSGKFREYLFHNTAVNHTLLFKGAWNMVSVLLTFNVTGAR